jgi:hypothetical protein
MYARNTAMKAMKLRIARKSAIGNHSCAGGVNRM